MRATEFSAAELRFLNSGRDLSRRKLHEQFVKKFSRHDLSEAALYFHAKKKGFRKKLGRPNERPIGFEVIQSGYVLVKTGQHTRMGSLPGGFQSM
jgi:hypothetical protein